MQCIALVPKNRSKRLWERERTSKRKTGRENGEREREREGVGENGQGQCVTGRFYNVPDTHIHRFCNICFPVFLMCSCQNTQRTHYKSTMLIVMF